MSVILGKLHNFSVATRTSILLVTLMGVLMLLEGIYENYRVKQVVAGEVARQASRSMDGAIKVIDNRVSNVETAVETAASYADMFATHEVLVNTLLRRLIEANEDISAATLLYRANYFPAEGRYYAPTIYREDGMLKEDEVGGPEHNFCYLETDSNWIYTNRKNSGYWCLPYLDTMSTNRPMVTYSVPLYEDDGSIYAVLCADVDLRWVRDLVEEAKPFPFSQVSVLSRDAHYICHPDSESILRVNAFTMAKRHNDPRVLQLTERMLRWEKGSDTMFFKTMVSSAGEDDEAINGPQIVYYAPVERVMWSVSFTFPESKIMERPNMLNMYMDILLLFMVLTVSVVTYFVIRAQLRPLKLLTASAKKIADGNFNVKLPVINTHDEIQRLRDSFEYMQHSLRRYVKELSETAANQASMESELKVAGDIQMAMLPKEFPTYNDNDNQKFDVFATLTPAKNIGGDLFDFYTRDEKLFFCIGDVSGKGVPASLVMAVTRTLFRTVSSHEASPERLMQAINERLSVDNESGMFVTFFIGVLDLPTGRLRYCNAGHDAPILIGKTIGSLPVAPNIPLGVLSGWKYNMQETKIDYMTTIFLYTDGLTEAMDIDNRQFGQKRIKSAIDDVAAKHKHLPKPLIEHMTAAVAAFVGRAEQSDDLTMVAIQYTKQELNEHFVRSITLPNDVQDVPRLAEFVDSVCEEVGFDMTTTMQMNLAIEEAVVNVMNYAYPPGQSGEVNIEAMVNDVRLKVVISDQGLPFDPTAKGEVDTTLSAEDRPIGGLGIHLVRQLMDTINYERVDGRNILTLRKLLKTSDKNQ